MTTKRCDEWPVLTPAEVKAKMSSFPLWELVENDEKSLKLSRKFSTKDFVSALAFIAAAGEIAESRNHHPDLHITGYRNVEVLL